MSTSSEAHHPDVLVIGAGVTGLTTAVVLAEAGLDVRVDAARPPAATTSAAAGATWDPFLINPWARVERWAEASLAVFRHLASEAPESGVRLVRGTHQSSTPAAAPDWALALGARPCTGTELRAGYVAGWRFEAPVIDMPRYLDWLAQRLARGGGRIRSHVYRSLDEARGQAPVVVNCSGSGAAELVPDPAVIPVRGQVVVVRRCGLDEFFCDESLHGAELLYAFPHGDTAVLGGTAEPGAKALTASPATAAAILRRCTAVLPELRGTEVLGSRVGLRPTRSQVRLEAEPGPHGVLIHNYGHGGAGVTTSWGCAFEVQRLASGDGAFCG
ncbi:FAD-dependent oxidoreductase [Kitasatospora sp. NPDC004669]|uniref:FAD-dependent oxidoreductase n=1 Tax=Kitasatospora sp. NPDC004669 TaxID=3154555 RepID=UPI0033B9BA38